MVIQKWRRIFEVAAFIIIALLLLCIIHLLQRPTIADGHSFTERAVPGEIQVRLDSDDSSNEGATLNELEESDSDEVSNPEELKVVSNLMSDHEVEGPQQDQDHDEALEGQVLDPGTNSDMLSDLEELGQGEDSLEGGTAAVLETSSSKLELGDDQEGNGKLYTIVMYLTGQQASGVQVLINLQCRANSLDLPMAFLEPIIVQNKFRAMPTLEFGDTGASLVRRDPVVQFHDLFDFDNFNKISKEMDYAQLVPRNTFFETAPRKIVFVVLYDGEVTEVPKLIKLWPKPSTANDSCFDPLTSQLGSDPKYQLYQIIKKGFCVVKVFLFRMTHGEPLVFTETQLTRYILGGMKTIDFTLVFNVWMPKFVLPGIKGRDCIHAGYHSSKGQFQPSKRLLDNANYYKERFLSTHSKHLALMIRLEHVYTFLGRRKSKLGDWTVEKCLDAAIEEVKYFQSQKSFGKPFVTLDVGRYGSKSLRSIGVQTIENNTRYINKLLSTVYDGEWSLAKWENSFTESTGGIVDSSYVAALQRTLASRAECLVLVGGGMFQELTMRKYMESHSQEDWCIHFVCIKDKIYNELDKP